MTFPIPSTYQTVPIMKKDMSVPATTITPRSSCQASRQDLGRARWVSSVTAPPLPSVVAWSCGVADSGRMSVPNLLVGGALVGERRDGLHRHLAALTAGDNVAE